jgi:hypothetical protein
LAQLDDVKMPITVLSPYSGTAVSVREQDVGRAVRDGEGKVFYVLPRIGGQGYYASKTRSGGEAEERNYQEIEARGPTGVLEPGDRSRGTGAEAQPGVAAHDATGRRQPKVRLRVILLVIMTLAFGVGMAAILVRELKKSGMPPASAPTHPATQPGANLDDQYR